MPKIINSSGEIKTNGTGSATNIAVSDLADGTDGELITWDSAGVATTVAVGTSTHVLTSNGAGAEPTFQAATGGISNVVEDTSPQLGGMLDVNGNSIGDGTRTILAFQEDGSAVNNVAIENEATGNGPIIRGTGSDTNVDLHLVGKGTGNVILRDGANSTKRISFEIVGSTTGTTTTISSTSTAHRTITLPDADDTLVAKDTTDTLTNKTIDTASNTLTVVEADISDLGSYITASSADVLTNKTIDTASNTITVVEADISDLGSYITAASVDTLTNKTFDANGTGNSLSNVDVADLANGTDGELITWDSSAAPATVAAGSSGEVLTSNGAGAAPTFQTGGSSDYVLIASATASASATIEFTGLSSTYFKYVAVLNDIVPTTDASTLNFRTSTDGGSSYDSGASDYAWTRSFTRLTATPAISNSADDADAQIVLSLTTGNSTNEQINGEVIIINPSSTKYTTILSKLVMLNNATVAFENIGSGLRLSAADVDGIQFIMSAGTIASGTIKLYGVIAA